MTEKYSLQQIRQFWTRQALEHGQSPAASWSDQMIIEKEIKEILERLTDGDQVLDAGCANGYSTVEFASKRRINVRGIDYIPEMIEQARTRLKGLANKLLGNVEFDVGDITALDEPTGAYDKVVVIRVIISLGEWSHQLKGLLECVRVLKPGGILLLSEATLQGWRQLNKLRREWGLPDIPMPPFNKYLDQEQVVEAVSSALQLIDIVSFSSTYYVGTRVLKALVIQALGAKIDPADPNTEWNRWFAQLPSWGEYGTQKLFVFRRI